MANRRKSFDNASYFDPGENTEFLIGYYLEEVFGEHLEDKRARKSSSVIKGVFQSLQRLQRRMTVVEKAQKSIPSLGCLGHSIFPLFTMDVNHLLPI